MDVDAMISDLTSHFDSWKAAAVADAEKFAAEHLPVLNDLKAAAGNPVVQSVLAAEHVSPEILAGLATVIDKLEADLAASEAARQAAEAAAAPPAPEVPADPSAAA